MPSLLQAATSQVGRKLLTGITGILLVLFIVVHLTGNLTMFGSAEAMNRYSLMLHDLGPLLWLARIGLLAFFLVHAWTGISIWLKKRRARPEKYEVYSSKGGPSKQSLSSRSMVFTGFVLLIFVVIHIQTFALGDAQMVELSDGRMATDMKSLVLETFQDPLYAFGYAIVMLILGTHLGHGIWSAFTSLGMSNKKMSAAFYTIGAVVAILLAVGFIFIPIYIYFGGGCEAALIQCE
jgi:succinate dehydrogenase / fumarate reductase cytochrome b subunit